MSHRLLIVTGRDRPGIVSAVSGLLASRNINLEDLRMSILEGEFAMMVVVCIPEKRLQTILERELKNLAQKWKLTIFQCPLGSKPAAKKTAKQKTLYSKDTTFVVRVLGRDKAGIVAGISRILAQNHFNITDLQCKILGSGAKALYAMVLECSAPPKASFKSLAASLNRFARALDIEVRLQKADLVQL